MTAPKDYVSSEERLKPKAERHPDYDEWDKRECFLGAALVYATAGIIFGAACTYLWLT